MSDNLEVQQPELPQNTQPQAAKNPLASWYRQPKIYVSLPSKGKFYPAGSLDVSANGEYAVYAMTAKDELMFKTPDALLSGQSTVEIIKSCIPAIKDPWVMPSIDLDFALIAIRIATYGESMEVGCKCPSCSADNSYDVNLSHWIGQVSQFNYDDVINIEPLTVYIRPYTYQEVTKTSIKALEQQRIFNIINDDSLSDEEKVDKFGKSFVKMTELTVDIISDTVKKIVTPDGETSDKEQIKEFINNCSKDVFDLISSRVTSIKEQIELKAQNVKCNECDHEFSLPITMDQSNFFAKG
jgi:hypothetical protein